MGELEKRRALTSARFSEIQKKLEDTEKSLEGLACIYTTGSFGRCEAGPNSDLDLFIVGNSGRDGNKLLRELNEICIKADLIRVTRSLKFPEFSGDGQYLVSYTIDKITKNLGKQEDDAENTLTARLLLLLESAPLIGSSIYKDAIHAVIRAYWRDYEDHKDGFIPAFLVNDILRLWRTFCVNYEARSDRDTSIKKAKGKIKNFKLKHSRLLTCYSALLYLLAIYRQKGMASPEDAFLMTTLTPTARLEWIRDHKNFRDVHVEMVNLIIKYESFLETTSVSEEELIDKFLNKETSRSYMDDSYSFGDAMFRALSRLGGEPSMDSRVNRFYRLMVV